MRIQNDMAYRHRTIIFKVGGDLIMYIHGFIYNYFCYLSLKQRNLEMRTLICPQRITKYLYVYLAI